VAAVGSGGRFGGSVGGGGRCLCLFEAENAGDVEALNREAQLPFDRVIEALDLPPAAS
jgi:hypothetical protein